MPRLDIALVERRVCKTRSQALLAVKEKNVLVNGTICTRPNKEIKLSDALGLLREPRFVSRGGDKLAAALEHFKISITSDMVALDIGSSTGGFTDCLLQAGAARVYAIDVGTGQFDPVLKSDPRIILKEKTDIRALTQLPERANIIVIDVSFISLTHIIPRLPLFISKKGIVVLLVKPQFEVGRGNVNRQGLVTNTDLYPKVIESVSAAAVLAGFEILGTMQSPLLGGTGNTEFLLCLHYR
jgi:23S rRNA (cytidine1920-2'-O)/16S rRNA (cytidine1409-2'-O)-methyltransferase